MQQLGWTVLRELEERDLDRIAGWDSDPELAHLMGGVPISSEESRSRYLKMLKNRNSLVMAIVDRSGGLIGDIELTEIAWRSGDAELSIKIGDPAYRDRGIGESAVREMLSIAFEGLGLRRVYLRVCSDNPRAVKCYKKCGFRREGVVRRRLGPDDQIRVVTLMTILRSDFMRFQAVS
jgi:RimJ/RimL family protein N-acetyltransferase